MFELCNADLHRNIQATSIEQPWDNSWFRCGLTRRSHLRILDSFLFSRTIPWSLSSTHHLLNHLLPRHNAPSSDQIIRVPRKQRLPIRAPRQAHTLRLPALLAHGRILGLQLVDLALLLEIEDDDGARRRGAQPVSVRGEDEGVDLVAGAQGVEVLGFIKIPKHGCAVFAAGGAQGAVGGDGHGVDVAGVAYVVRLNAAGGEFPDLEKQFCQRRTPMADTSAAQDNFLVVVISA